MQEEKNTDYERIGTFTITDFLKVAAKNSELFHNI